jgi:hypothetical protein
MEVPSDRNRLYLEGRRQGARRLSSDVDLDWSDADDALP